ncbi:MAG: hypothetical protein KAU07_02345 [Candidatus Andersenbacteria bacterium]|nr:hypothetical protein [Candidatus Andersenbacteria bacterium]
MKSYQVNTKGGEDVANVNLGVAVALFGFGMVLLALYNKTEKKESEELYFVAALIDFAISGACAAAAI